MTVLTHDGDAGMHADMMVAGNDAAKYWRLLMLT